MAFTEIMNLKQRNEFCCQVVMGVNPHPSIFSKDNIPGGCDVKVYFMLFHFIFYNFVERVMELKLNKTKERIFFMVWQWYFLHRHNLAFQLLWLVRVCIGNCFFTVLACLTQQYVMEMYGAKDIDIVVSSSNFYLKPR